MITERDQEILEALSLRTPVLSMEQIGRTWFSEGTAVARKRMTFLAESNWLKIATVAAHPILKLAAPVFTWKPGEQLPDPRRISRDLQSRWTRPLRPTAVCVPTRRTLSAFGGKARRLAAAQATHDLHVAEVFLRYRTSVPDKAARWTGEGVLASRGRNTKLPDAIIAGTSDEPPLVVEFGGAYPAARVDGILEHCLAENLPLEIW